MKKFPIKDNQNSNIQLEIYADEIFNQNCKIDNSNWTYLGLLFVPIQTKRKLIKNLKNLRCIKNRNWNEDKSLCKNP